jgi:hypothetical protein
VAVLKETGASDRFQGTGRRFAVVGWMTALLSPGPLIAYFILLPIGMALTGGGHGSGPKNYHFGAIPIASAVGLATVMLLYGVISARAGASLARGEERGRSTLASVCWHCTCWVAFFTFFPSAFLEPKFWQVAHPFSHAVRLVLEYLFLYLVLFTIASAPFWLALHYLRNASVAGETVWDAEPTQGYVLLRGALPSITVVAIVFLLARGSGHPFLSDDFFSEPYTTSDERSKIDREVRAKKQKQDKDWEDSEAIFKLCLPVARAHPEFLGELDGRQPALQNRGASVTRNADGTATLNIEVRSDKYYFALWAPCTAKETTSGVWKFIKLDPPFNEPRIKARPAPPPAPAGLDGRADLSIDLSGRWDMEYAAARSCGIGIGILVARIAEPPGAYSIASCLGDACEPPQRHYENSYITGAADFEVLSADRLRMRNNNGWATYRKCQ